MQCSTDTCGVSICNDIVTVWRDILYIHCAMCSQQFDIDAKSNLEQTALHLASKGGHDDIVKLLLDNNARDAIADKAM